MKLAKRTSKKETIAKRGHAMYLRMLRKELAHVAKGRVVGVDVNSGDFEVADNALQAGERLFERHPKAHIWYERVGYRTMVRIGIWHEEEPK